MNRPAIIAVPDWQLDLSMVHEADIDSLKTILDSIAKVEARGFIWRGIIIKEIEQRELWRDDRAPDGSLFTSMNDWINRAPGKSARDRYAAKGAVEELKDIPLADLSRIPRCNLETMKKLSSRVRVKPATIEAAQGSEEGFVAHIQEHHPEQHVTRPVKPTLRLTPPVQDALDAYHAAYPDVEDRQGQLEGALIDWMQEREQ